MLNMNMLIGLPGSGKSTFLKRMGIVHAPFNGVSVLSTDRFIEEIADRTGKTYNEVFKKAIGDATIQLNRDLHLAIERGNNIFWDQTNFTVKSRADKLKRIPRGYLKTAVELLLPEDMAIWYERLDSRIGKNIPANVLDSMFMTYQTPTTKEGFDTIIKVKS